MTAFTIPAIRGQGTHSESTNGCLDASIASDLRETQ